ADVLEAGQRVGDLLRGAAQPVGLLLDLLVCHVHREAGVERDVVWVAARGSGGFAHVPVARRQLLGRDPREIRKPGIAVGAGAPLGALALAAAPDRDRLVVRLGVKRDVLIGVVLGLKRAVVLGE